MESTHEMGLAGRLRRLIWVLCSAKTDQEARDEDGLEAVGDINLMLTCCYRGGVWTYLGINEPAGFWYFRDGWRMTVIESGHKIHTKGRTVSCTKTAMMFKASSMLETHQMRATRAQLCRHTYQKNTPPVS